MITRPSRACAVAAVAVVIAPMARASEILVSHIGEGAGTLNGVPFAISTIEIDASGDSSNVTSFIDIAGNTQYWLPHDSATVLIGGLGTFSILTGTKTFLNATAGLVGVGRYTIGTGGNSDLFDGPTSPTLTAWDMLTSIGPVDGSGHMLQWGAFTPIQTSAGILVVNDGATPARFTAVVVPAPGAGMVVVAAALCASRRRRFGFVCPH